MTGLQMFLKFSSPSGRQFDISFSVVLIEILLKILSNSVKSTVEYNTIQYNEGIYIALLHKRYHSALQ